MKKNKSSKSWIIQQHRDQYFKQAKSSGFRSRSAYKLLELDKKFKFFKNCNLVIGPHGAGMANLIFCKRNTKVIEIQHFGHPNKVYQRISKFNKLKHHFIMLKKIKNEKKGDMLLEVRRLKNYLN